MNNGTGWQDRIQPLNEARSTDIYHVTSFWKYQMPNQRGSTLYTVASTRQHRYRCSKDALE
jgi:hypothetical protein